MKAVSIKVVTKIWERHGDEMGKREYLRGTGVQLGRKNHFYSVL